MNKRIFIMMFVALSAVLVSCDNETTTMPVEPVTIEGTFTSTEVELGISAFDDDYLPDFPFSDVLTDTSYDMTVSSNSQLLHQWKQDIRGDNTTYTYDATGDVIFNISDETNFTIPVSNYSLTGSSTVPYGESSTTIELTNTEYAGIAVYSPYVTGVTISAISVFETTVSTDKEEYFYSFLQPGSDYAVVIVDEQENVHTVNVTADKMGANSMLRLYLITNNVTGNFDVIIDWNVIDQPVNPVQ